MMNNFEVFKKILKNLWKLDKKYIISMFLSKLSMAARSLVFIYIPKLLIDLIQNQKGKEEIIGSFIIIVIVTASLYILEAFTKRIVKIEHEKISRLFLKQLSEKMMRVEYRYLEDAKYLDLKERAVMGINNMGGLSYFASLLGELIEITLILSGIIVIFLRLSPIVTIIMIVTQLLILFPIRRVNKTRMKVVSDLVRINRKYGNIVSTLYAIEGQKDIRLYDMSDMLTDKVVTYNTEMMQQFITLANETCKSNSIISFINYIVSASIILYSGLRVMTSNFGSRLSIGDFTLYTGSAIQFSSQLNKLIENLVSFVTNTNFLVPYLELMDLPEERYMGTEILDAQIDSIEFKNVTFTYPGTDSPVLKNISFVINKGEKISVVGLNGAGKTTLVKLICRFFKPDSGTILVNGIDISNYEYKSYMKEISAVFQDFKVLNFTIKENIMSGYEGKQTDNMIDELVKEVGLAEKIDKLSQGVESYIGKSFDEEGIDMSGGEKQKIAIARALYKDSSLIILDEPTSALDPIAEAEIYEHFNTLTNNKTVVYISHRMSSSVFCDKILLINNGEVEDFDSHKNLMKKTDSLYYKMFKAQADNYKIRNNIQIDIL